MMARAKGELDWPVGRSLIVRVKIDAADQDTERDTRGRAAAAVSKPNCNLKAARLASILKITGEIISERRNPYQLRLLALYSLRIFFHGRIPSLVSLRLPIMSSGDENQSARAAAGSPDDDSPVDGGSGGGSGSSELSDPRHALQPGCWYASGGGGSVELSDPRHGQPGGWDRSNIGGTVELSDTRPRHGHPGWYGGGGGRGSVEPSDPRHGRPGWYGINDDGGSTDVLDPRRGQSAWYGINGGGSGGAGPSNYVQQQHVGYPYWHVGGGGGDSSGGGSAFNLRDGFGAGDAHGIGPHDWRAANGVNRNRNYGGGTNDDGSWYWANGGAGDDGGSWYWQNGSASSGDWRDPAYVTDSFYENGEGSAFSSPPRVNAGIYQPQQPVTGYYWPGSGSNGGVDRPHAEFMPGGSNGGSSSFPLPRIPNGMPYEHQRARADHYWSNSAADDHRFDVLHGNGRPTFASPPRNGFGMHAAPDGRAPHSPPQRCAEVNELVANSLRDLTVGNNDSISAVHRGLPESLDEEGQALNAGDHDAPSYHGGLFNDADPYAGMRLEDVRGRMARVARDLTGCQFLARMVDEGGAAAARHVLDELAGDVVRLMADSPGHELVAKLAGFWTDEETIARVLGLLRAAPTGLILAAAKSHPGYVQ